MIKIANTRHENSMYNAFEFVSRAVAKTDERKFMRYVHKQGEYLIASDGHRLHVVLLINVVEHEVELLKEDGAYEIVVKNRKELIVEKVNDAPGFSANWKRALGLKDYTFAETTAGGKDFGMSKALCDTLRLCPEYQHFDLDYLLDVFKSGFAESWKVLMGKDLSACLFKNSFKAAVVMPVKS
jgi:hypothetical protein